MSKLNHREQEHYQHDCQQQNSRERGPRPQKRCFPLRFEPLRVLPILLLIMLCFSACAPQQAVNATVQCRPAKGVLAQIDAAVDLVVVNTASGVEEILLRDNTSSNKLIYRLQNLAQENLAEGDFFVFNYDNAGEREFTLDISKGKDVLLERSIQLDLSSRKYLIITEDGGNYDLVVEEADGGLISSLSANSEAQAEQDNQQLAASLYAAYRQVATNNDATARAELFRLLPQITSWGDFSQLADGGGDPLADLLGWLWDERASLSEQELAATIELAASSPDGAYSEGLQALYHDRFLADATLFLTAMSQASEAAQERAANLLAAELYYYAQTPWEDNLPNLDQQQQAALEQILAQKDYWLQRHVEDTAISE